MGSILEIRTWEPWKTPRGVPQRQPGCIRKSQKFCKTKNSLHLITLSIKTYIQTLFSRGTFASQMKLGSRAQKEIVLGFRQQIHPKHKLASRVASMCQVSGEQWFITGNSRAFIRWLHPQLGPGIPCIQLLSKEHAR